MKRTIISIDEDRCNGCGKCVPGCPEGALQIIDGKARLVADYFCDGLGACIGECPEGAITTEVRDAEQYDERRAFANIRKKGPNVIKAHLSHLHEHGETEYLSIALDECRKHGIEIPYFKEENQRAHTGCPGHAAESIQRTKDANAGDVPAELRNWPIQLKLLSPNAPYLKGADLLFAADCTAFAYPNIHRDHIRNRVCIILCPKLDSGAEDYVEKISQILSSCNINSISILRMQVPCCGGLSQIVNTAKNRSGVDVPVLEQIVTIDGALM
ncbi:MAG: ATP-binding protein [Spirochaetota bacterium]